MNREGETGRLGTGRWGDGERGDEKQLAVGSWRLAGGRSKRRRGAGESATLGSRGDRETGDGETRNSKQRAAGGWQEAARTGERDWEMGSRGDGAKRRKGNGTQASWGARSARVRG